MALFIKKTWPDPGLYAKETSTVAIQSKKINIKNLPNQLVKRCEAHVSEGTASNDVPFIPAYFPFC